MKGAKFMRNYRDIDSTLTMDGKSARNYFMRWATLLVALAFVVLFTGCGWGGTAESGGITVLTALPEEQSTPYLAAFKAEYPNIRLNIVRESADVLTERLLAEAEHPSADVIWGLPTSNLLLAEWYETLQPYAPAGLERVPMRFRDQAKRPHWVGMNAGMSAFCVNEAQMEKLSLPTPQSWQDLLDPVYERQIVMADPNESRNSFLTVSGILQIYGQTKGWQYLDELDSNIGQYTAQSEDSCELVAAGAYPIGISFGVMAEEASTQAVELVFPSEGSGWLLSGNALIEQKNIKPAAKTFLDWAISDAAMQQYAQNWVITAVETDEPIPSSFPSNPTEQLIESNLPWVAANRDSILSEWDNRYGS